MGCENAAEAAIGLGVRVNVDDVGAGYSSLAHPRDLPVDELKIAIAPSLTAVGENPDPTRPAHLPCAH